tara:strand:+ start:65 stop:454 length:390 start_codon:yes stop_codon:yes gene_type:complete
MARVQFVSAFVSMLALLLILVFVNSTLGITGISGAFGVGYGAETFAVETGFDAGISQMTTIETEPNMLTSLTANLEYANQIRDAVNSAMGAGSILVSLPLIPWWVGGSFLLLTLMGSVTLWYLISGKKI